MKRNSGFTLLEVLIASLLFSLIVFLSVYAFNQSFLYYGRLSEGGLDFSRYTRILWMYQSSSAIIDYFVYDDERKIWFPLFIGESDRIVYVTGNPLSSTLPALVILKKRD